MLINSLLRNSGQLQPQPGCNVEQTLEAKLNKILSDIREDSGKACINELHHLNAALIMALCGMSVRPRSVISQNCPSSIDNNNNNRLQGLQY